MDISKYLDMVIHYSSEYSLKIIAALLIFIIGKIVVKRVTHFSRKMMQKAEVDTTLTEFLESVIYFILLLLVILASLSALGINTTSFIAVFVRHH
jgi:small conductance mechanosensitive channel